MNSLLTFFSRGKAFIIRYTNKRTLAALLIVVLFLGVGIVKGIISSDTAEDDSATERQVRVAPAGLIAANSGAVLETTGEVNSQTQGDLRAQRAGVITNVYSKVGQKVSGGTIIASIENASERASVAQAQAGVAQAKASFNKIAGGTREEQLAVLAATTANAEQALREVHTSIKNALLSAYTTTDSTFTGGVDVAFSDADGANPQLKFGSTNSSQTLAAEHARFILEATIARHAKAATQVTFLDGVALRSELTVVEDEMKKIKAFLDNLINALDGGIATASVTSAELTSYKTTATTARANVLGTLSSLSSVRGSLNAAENAVTIAKENQAQGITGAQQEDIDVAQAQLDAAQATLAQAIAQLENTRVRAPVSGVLTILSVSPGDFVTAFEDIGLVANESALEVQTFVAPSAINRITVGNKALIDQGYEGIVTSIAPGIDPIKKQIEVRIAFVGDSTNIPHGSRVSVRFLAGENTVITQTNSPILVPIAALKLVGDSASVFTVDSQTSTLVAREVVLGKVIQSSVEITSGISTDTLIVLDARGLNEGDAVIVAN